MVSVTSNLVHLLTKHPADPELVRRCINEQDWGPCWEFATRRKRSDRPSQETRVIIQRKSTTRHTYLFQQLMDIPRATLFEIRRGPQCHPRCFNPWHCHIAYLERRNKQPGKKGTHRWKWEWPEVPNRYALFKAIVNGEITGATQYITLEEYYENYATEEEKEARASKDRRTGRFRGVRGLRGTGTAT